MFEKLYEIKTLICQPTDEDIVDTALLEEGHTIVHKKPLGTMLHYIVALFHSVEE